LKNGDGMLEWSHDQKEQIMYSHFKNLLGTKLQREETINWDLLELPHLSEACLDAPFTEAEIKRVVAELPTEKAPGPDGLTGLFYKSCWDIVKLDVIAAV
jgi:hypothetical protein